MDLPENTVRAFAGLCGATIVVMKAPDVQDSWAFTWSCLGCGGDSGDGSYEAQVIREANRHAGLCRSVPLPSN